MAIRERRRLIRDRLDHLAQLMGQEQSAGILRPSEMKEACNLLYKVRKLWSNGIVRHRRQNLAPNQPVEG